MIRKKNLALFSFLIFLTISVIAAPAYSGADHHDDTAQEKDHAHDEAADSAEDGHDHDHAENHTESTQISDAAASASGIETAEAGPETIDDYVTLTGHISLNQNKSAVIKARFPGIVRSVTKTQGESVKAGETLATVESNESLQVYAVKAPISGIILSRNTNIGDVAGDAALFTITDINELWAELHIFPQDISRIKTGQDITLSSSECEDTQTTTIMATLPIIDAPTQTLLARAVINNIDEHWAPGMSVRGEVVTGRRAVPLAVRTSALQTLEGKKVIFVKEGDEYHARTVETGSSNKTWTEITSGLKTGEHYVSKGSFTVKADIGKSGAAHEH